MSKHRRYSVERKLEVVKAKQNGLTTEEVAAMFGVGTTSINIWAKAYAEKGLPGLEDESPGRPQQLSPKTQAAEKFIDRLAREHPGAGISKVQGLLFRHGLLSMARETVRRVLRRHGHEPQLQRFHRRNAPKRVRFFECAHPNDMWQTDIMTFMLKGQYRVY